MEIDLDTIINAGNYENICDYSIIPQENKLFTENIIEKNSIIFCKTDYIDYLFYNLQKSNNSHVVITHHSDYPIDHIRYNTKPKCIKKWFAINPTVIDDDLITIPLGIKTHKGAFLEPKYMTEWFASNVNSLRKNNKSFSVYCNWGNTNPERNNIISKLQNNNIKITYERNVTFDVYAKNMSSHKFVISPPGNGIDCHRTWESLYLGCIPIVIKNYIYEAFRDLPIIQVNDYSEVTQELLESIDLKQYSYEKLNINYWSKVIKDSL